MTIIRFFLRLILTYACDADRSNTGVCKLIRERLPLAFVIASPMTFDNVPNNNEGSVSQ